MTVHREWYAIYTRPRWEKKVAERIKKIDVEIFCPLNKTVKQWADRKKVVFEPLFSCYVFVHASQLEQIEVKCVEGVLNFVHWDNRPAIIKKSEIEAIKEFLDSNSSLRIERIDIKQGDVVRVKDGIFMDSEGAVVKVNNNTVKISLPSIGYSIMAQMDIDKVELL